MDRLKKALLKCILLISAGISRSTDDDDEFHEFMSQHLKYINHYAAVSGKILVSLAIVVISLNQIINDYNNSWLPELYTYEILKIGQMIFSAVAANTVEWYYYYKKNVRDEISNEYNKIEKYCREYCRVEHFPRISKVFASFYSIFILLLIASVAVEWIVHQHCDKFWQNLWWCEHLLEEFACISFIAQYIVIVEVLTMSVKVWNEKISVLTRFQSTAIEADDEGKISRNFKDFKRMFETLHDLISTLSKFYSFPAFIILAYNAYTVYVMVYTFVAQMKFGIRNDLALVYSTFWFALFISLQWTWVSGIESLLKQLAETPDNISDLSDALPKNDELKIQVEKFEKWIRNRKIEITAGGVISLNKKYLLTLLGFIGTWVVVLIEWYDPADHSKKTIANETLTNKSLT